MAELIVIRIHPADPSEPAAFGSALAGLTITVFDRSFAQPTTGDSIGSASFDTPTATGAIVQHLVKVLHPAPTPPEFPMFSVATAAIVIDRTATPTEYDHADLFLKITRRVGGQDIPIADSSLNYNVDQFAGSLPPAPASGDSIDTIASKTANYMNLTSVSLFWAMPVLDDDPNKAHLSISTDGTPPNFDALRDAVEKVLAQDPTGVNIDLTKLSVERCRNIAYEIVWNRKILPLPGPSTDLANLYTKPFSDSDDNRKARQQFESDLVKYYTTNNGQADILTKYVFGLSAALACQKLSVEASQVGFTFPILLSGQQLGKIAEATVALSRNPLPPGPTLGFDVPAPYFYALAATLPTNCGIDLRFRTASIADPKQIVTTLQTAINSSVISDNSPTVSTVAPHLPPGPAPISLEQAARRLQALGVGNGATPVCVPGVGKTLVGHWLAYNSNNTGDPIGDLAKFWDPTTLTATDLSDHRDLVLCDITELSEPDKQPNDVVTAVKDVAPPIKIDATDDLKAITTDQWIAVFTLAANRVFPKTPEALLKDVVGESGSIPQRVSRWVRRLTHYFDVTKSTALTPTATLGFPPQLDKSINDPIASFVGAGFQFGQSPPLDPTSNAFINVVNSIFPGDADAQAWLTETVLTIDALYFVSDVFPAPPPPPTAEEVATRFSIAEALYARGFTDKASIAALSLQDFTDALIGTVAYIYADKIHLRAGGSNVPVTPPGQGTFGPINPGELTNCIPSPELSPLGPVAYLHGLLALSSAATCEQPNPPPSDGELPPTLGALLATRRGPLGDLSVTRANLETPLPMIDLVNECLEAMVAVPQTSGVVYDTATDKVGDHLLRQPHQPADEQHHDPSTLMGALAEHSSPATPVEQPHAYELLGKELSVCCLPYSQPLDVNRSYLQAIHTTRFSAMRHFRKDISEFVLDPTNEPVTFPRHRWRYPVRIDVAREYLRISQLEHELLYSIDLTASQVQALFGFSSDEENWIETVVVVSEFLERTCLSYCEFLELWRSTFVPFHRQSREERTSRDFPDCPPCYLDKERIVFDGEQDAVGALKRLALFIRLWRTLKSVPYAHYSFATLRDICDVLRMFVGGAINPDFIRQLAAFQMLRDDFHLELSDPSDTAPGIDDARTHLLALFVGPTAAKWHWVLERLLYHIEHHARRHHGHKRTPEFLKLLVENLTPLSALAGFDPATPANTWWAAPTHALRFAEVLAKIYGSRFSIGELLYLLAADEHIDGDDPFLMPEDEETLDTPFELPDEERTFSLWRLREALHKIEISDEEAEKWSWPRIESTLRDRFGLVPAPGQPDPLLTLGQHFFPRLLEHHGHTVSAHKRQYRVSLVVTTPAMWQTPPEGPFNYDGGTKELLFELPLRDEAVLNKLSRIRPLSSDEQNAVRDLYFLPRIELAVLAFVFENFEAAADRLIQEPDERERWHFFRKEFARCYERCRAIAHHLAAHVDSVTGTTDEHGPQVAWRLLRSLLADENRAKTAWEDDSGKRPKVTWGPSPAGGAFAAVLGLAGTGLQGDFSVDGKPGIVWRELRGPMDAFGRVRNEWNAPVPTVIPSMAATLTNDQMRYEGVRNGIALANRNAERLGGAQSFCVTWRGVLMVDEAGTYRFWAGAPTPGHEKPDTEHAHNRRWRVSLRRGQRSWILLNHHWSGEGVATACSAPLSLRCGAYDLTIELVQCPPTPDDLEDYRPQKTGFELKYEGPDTKELLVAVPFEKLFIAKKDAPLSLGLEKTTSGNAALFLETLYVSSLRDVRRTYQRAFKAMLFARRFELSTKVFHDYGQSELGYVIDHPDNFAGISFYSAGGAWTPHLAGFDFNFLPLLDNYHPPQAADDDRVAPLQKRKQALFDSWERIFDYVELRREASQAPDRPVWLMFDEAAENQPDNAAQLLRHVDIDLSHASLVLKYYLGYSVTAADLMDERWTIRVWRADEWLERAVAHFFFKDVREARPDLWASTDPGVLEAGESETANQNLTRVVQDGLIENGPPRRYEDLKRIDDGLRERARCALVAYLCAMNRVPLPAGGFATMAKQLSEVLLLDVEVGVCERASRIDEAITAVQLFVQRARLGLEPSFVPTPGFMFLWERRFETFRVWQACVRRTLYRENWIEWDELEEARRTEGFRFLESELRRASLTAPVPGGLEYWDGPRPPAHLPLKLLQAREPSTLKLIEPPPVKSPPPTAYDEALDLLGTPARSARRSWLAPVSASPRGGNDGGGDDRPIPNAVGGGTLSAPMVRSLARAATGNNSASSAALPWWIEAAIRLGTRFVRIAAAGIPPASTKYEPRADGEGCCRRCGCQHEPLVDEFYFWLIDSRWYEKLEGNSPNDPDVQDADTPGWHDAAQLPTLLAMSSKPMVHLMWARWHNGQLEAPRRSSEGVRLRDDSVPGSAQLQFAGRTLDSLRFEITEAVTPPGINPPPPPGFRYDLAIDAAIVVPEVGTPPSISPPTWGGMPAYPYFGYFEPGAPLFPLTPFVEATAVAATLRAHCRFEPALKWYALALDPLHNDVNWCPQPKPVPPPRDSTPTPTPTPTTPVGVVAHPVEESGHSRRSRASRRGRGGNSPPPTHSSSGRTADGANRGIAVGIVVEGENGLCCRDAAVTDPIARDRAITLDYLDTLVEWGDCLMLRNSPEAFQQARLIFDVAAKILGPTPHIVEDEHVKLPAPKVSNFKPAHAPLNPRLVSLYERVADRLSLIHACDNAHRLRNGRLDRDMRYFGDDPARDGWRTVKHVCDDDCECCCPPTPYRFVFMVEKAKDLAGQTRELGGALLAAYEKGDAEYLAYVRAEQEKQLVQLALEIKQNQLRDADWQVQALQKTKEIAHTNLNYYQRLINTGLISGEHDYEDLTNGALGSRTAATVLDTICEIMNFIPDIHVGTVDFVDLPIGTKLSRVFETGARISNEIAEILSVTAGLRLTQTGWDRREDEWRHQVDVLTIEIEQIERQILGAERRRAVALRELNTHRRQIEQSREMIDVLRDKFTNHQLYLFLQKETAALYYQMYELALCCARQAQRAFNYERDQSARRFIPADAWDSLREGLLAGERLQLGLRRMEKAYYEENARQYELTKHISLAIHLGAEFLELKRTGKCEIELPEWLFDLDYPGQYMRRIKNVTLTIPCVTGPYTGVHCRMTLLSSMTRTDPRLHGPVTPCCKEPLPKPLPQSVCGCYPPPRSAMHERKPYDASANGYVALPDDPRIVTQYAATEAIATSSGQNDAGLFELNFRDERYLPFEFAGAVSRWRIELPQENNFFDVDTLADIVLHLNYTAREGGDVLRRAANEVAQRHIPDAGIHFFDVSREFAGEWQRLQERQARRERPRLELALERRHFPFLPGDREVWITRVELFFEADHPESPTHHEVEFVVSHKPGCRHAEHDEHEFECSRSLKWPGLYQGVFDIQAGPLRGAHTFEGVFRFEDRVARIRRAFLICHYEAR